MGGIVFATFNVPGPGGGAPGAGARNKANVAWLNAAFDEAVATHAPAVMLIMQDNPFEGDFPSGLWNNIKKRTTAFGKPVVLVHGDTHHYQIDNPTPMPNFTRVETWAVEDTDKWVHVTADPASPGVFTFETVRAR
jgi:hypothetical protein